MVRDCLELIEESLQEPISVAGLARRAGTSAAGNPPALEHVRLPPRKYALFEHHGALSTLRATVDSIFAVWLTNNDEYTTDGSPTVEIYTPRFRPGRPASVMTIGVPLVPRRNA